MDPMESDGPRGSGRAVVALLVGALIGFAAGYFAGGGGRPGGASGARASGPASGATAEVEAAVARDPENPELLRRLGNLQYDREEWDAAVDSYEKARRKAPKDADL